MSKLLVCSFLLLFLSCNTSTKKLPILSYTIDDSGKRKDYKITYKGFTNQLGHSFSSEDLKGKTCIVNFFFTRCPSICPPMRTELIQIAEEFSEDKNLMFISHTIDPKHDSISVLKTYAEATGIPHHQWQFLRATEAHTKAQAKQYMTNFKPNEDGSDFYHSSFVALVDKEQQIRGFYNVLVKEDVTRLKIDIHNLLNQ
ncbi:SCO family protein [Psychroserpens sp. S379A]|uniref:SCO family protein n=1 Tax=Psychroserpens sp. S379A TaxID=3415137 RepID=UPI003C7C2E32